MARAQWHALRAARRHATRGTSTDVRALRAALWLCVALRVSGLCVCTLALRSGTDALYPTAMPAPPLESASVALKQLVLWSRKRDQADVGSQPLLPSVDEVQQQFELLCRRLREAAREAPFAASWKDAKSGTIIMKDVFTMDRFRKGQVPMC